MVEEYSASLMGMALRLTRRREEAEDLVQETLFRAYRGLATFRPGTNFRAWLFRIQRNAFLNRLRRDGAAPLAVDMAEMDPPERERSIPAIRSVDEVPDLADRHFDDQVKAAIERMPDAFRDTFLLLALGEMSYAEIAETLGIPVGTVMSRLFRARRFLREELLEYARQRGLDGGGGL